MAISSEAVKKLRDKTGAGMMDCKRALEATDGKIEQAIEHLRKKGVATAEKRADRETNQGMTIARINDAQTVGIIVELNCETDFVARSDDFMNFGKEIAGLILSKEPATVEALLLLPMSDGISVTDGLMALIGKIGEKIAVRRFEIFHTEKSFLDFYTHMGSKISVIVDISAAALSAELKALSHDIAMQIAAMSPHVVTRDQVKKEVIEHELEIYRQLAKNEGKPEQILEKIANGRLEKYYAEVVLMEQSFIKDAAKTIKDIVNEAKEKFGSEIGIRRFIRYQLGAE